MPTLLEIRNAATLDELAAKGLLDKYVRLCADPAADPHFVAMSLLRRAPGARTDREFLRGREVKDYQAKAAMKAGVSVGGKVHMRGLGPATDPKSWVSSRDDVLRVAQERRLRIKDDDDNVLYEPPPTRDDAKPTALHPRIVKEVMAEKVAQNPALAKDKEKLREQVMYERAPERKHHLIPDELKKSRKKKPR